MNSITPTTRSNVYTKKSRKLHTLKYLEKFVKPTRFDDAIDCIANCHKTSGYFSASMLLAGESGSGKTTLIRHYLESFPAQELPTGRVLPVLYVSLEARTTVKSILAALLEGCGDPNAESGTDRKMTKRLRNYIRKLKIELIIIDELQHVLPEHAGRKMEDAADFLKALINSEDIPFILVGLPSSQKIITLMSAREGAEKQVERRWRSPCYLRAEQYSTTRWKNMVTHYQKKLGVPCINLATEEMLKRLFVASNGLHGFVSKILEETLELSDGIKQIDMTLLAKGYNEATSVHRLSENPFACEKRIIDDMLVTAIGRQNADLDYWGRLLKGEA